MGSIQTILANTAKYGTELPEVTANLEELNEYSDKTIYHFSEMAKNIGTFTAAGVDLPKSTEAIKGIANMVALAGQEFLQQLANAVVVVDHQQVSAGAGPRDRA